MSQIPLEQLARDYLLAYAAKDIEAIGNLITSQVQLQDWNVSGEGAEFFLSETKKNFESAKSIEIQIRRLICSGAEVAAQLHIQVDGSEGLEVVDVISFDDSGKITAIRAYKG
jgi:steroid delta-isomerase